MAIEWKCGHCGQWVSDRHYSHTHAPLSPPALSEQEKQDRVLKIDLAVYRRTGREITRQCDT